MNKNQTFIMWVGIIAFAIIGLNTETRFGFFERRHTDYSQVAVRLASIVLITGGLIITFKDKKPKDKQKQ